MFAINAVTAKYFIKKKGFDDLKIALKLDYIYHLKIALHKNMPDEVISILDKSLASITGEELNNIFNKWTEISIEQYTDWKFLLKITGVLFIVIMFLIWSNRRLNLKVKTRTEELSSKNIELREALKEIKTLSGIIPICSYCHSIRDDEGKWNRLEAYLSNHSDARFSHGMCPKCEPKARLEAGLDENQKT